jgi:hypothetical protein
VGSRDMPHFCAPGEGIGQSARETIRFLDPSSCRELKSIWSAIDLNGKHGYLSPPSKLCHNEKDDLFKEMGIDKSNKHPTMVQITPAFKTMNVHKASQLRLRCKLLDLDEQIHIRIYTRREEALDTRHSPELIVCSGRLPRNGFQCCR